MFDLAITAEYKSFELVMCALEVARAELKPGGALVAKIFQGAEFEEARDAFRKTFEKVRILRPKAVRDESYEVFLVGLGRKEPTSDPSQSE